MFPQGQAMDSHHGVPMDLVDLTGLITSTEPYFSAVGGFANIVKGLWDRGATKCQVAVKVLRVDPNNEGDRRKKDTRLRRELSVWKRLNHENIIPLYGIAYQFGPCASMVSPWLENGDLTRYLVRHQDTLMFADRLRMLREVATGLKYLHDNDVIHGDLTGSNVLINADRKCILCDFGLSTILAEFEGTSFFTSSIHGAIRWAAPEIYRYESDGNGDNSLVRAPGISFYSDIYSFGSVMLQILSGRIPYHYLKTTYQVQAKLIGNEYPNRPCCIPNIHWEFVMRCWALVPNARPTASVICDRLADLMDAYVSPRGTTITALPSNHAGPQNALTNLISDALIEEPLALAFGNMSVSQERQRGRPAAVASRSLNTAPFSRTHSRHPPAGSSDEWTFVSRNNSSEGWSSSSAVIVPSSPKADNRLHAIAEVRLVLPSPYPPPRPDPLHFSASQ